MKFDAGRRLADKRKSAADACSRRSLTDGAETSDREPVRRASKPGRVRHTSDEREWLYDAVSGSARRSPPCPLKGRRETGRSARPGLAHKRQTKDVAPAHDRNDDPSPIVGHVLHTTLVTKPTSGPGPEAAHKGGRLVNRRGSDRAGHACAVSTGTRRPERGREAQGSHGHAGLEEGKNRTAWYGSPARRKPRSRGGRKRPAARDK